MKHDEKRVMNNGIHFGVDGSSPGPKIVKRGSEVDGIFLKLEDINKVVIVCHWLIPLIEGMGPIMAQIFHLKSR